MIMFNLVGYRLQTSFWKFKLLIMQLDAYINLSISRQKIMVFFFGLFLFSKKSNQKKMSLNLTELVLRPGTGKVGRRVRVKANFFEVNIIPSQNIHHYDVAIDPAVTPPAVLKKEYFFSKSTQIT
jgi:hypothetical protein